MFKSGVLATLMRMYSNGINDNKTLLDVIKVLILFADSRTYFHKQIYLNGNYGFLN